MNDLTTIAESIGAAEPWVQKGRAQWLACQGKSPRELTLLMNEKKARFITITALKLPDDEGIRLDYHWDLDGQLLGFRFETTDKLMESIYDLCEAANWVEREIHEYFAIEFTQR